MIDVKAVNEKRNVKIPYEHCSAMLPNISCDIIKATTNCYYDEDTNYFDVKLMNRLYKVHYPSGEIFKENLDEFSNYEIKTIIIRYLLNAKGVPPSNKYITFKEIPGGPVYYPNFSNRTIGDFVNTFGYNLNNFSKVCELLGGEKLNLGDISYKIQFMNNIYMVFTLWAGDNDISPSGNILFDANTQFYFDAEDLSVIGDIAVGFLKKLLNNNFNPEDGQFHFRVF